MAGLKIIVLMHGDAEEVRGAEEAGLKVSSLFFACFFLHLMMF